MTNPPIKVAFVGCSHPHIFYRLTLLSNIPDAQLIGCYDPDRALADQFEQKYGLNAFSSAEVLLDQPGVNFVIIEGWDTDNPDYARLAAQRGQAILLEKPGAPNLPEMRMLITELRSQPIPFQIGYQLRYSPVITHVRRILSEEVLGSITLARFHAAAPVGAARESWQSVPGDLGGVVYTDGCHMIDLIIHLFDMPHRVKGTLLKLPEGSAVLAQNFKSHTFSGSGETLEMPLGGVMYEDAGAALLSYDDKVVTFDITGWEAHPWVEAWRIEIYGTNGTLYVGLQPPQYRLYVRITRGDYQAGWHCWEGSHKPEKTKAPTVNINYTSEMEHMLARVCSWDTDNNTRLTQAESVIVVLDAIFRSDRENRDIEIKTIES